MKEYIRKQKFKASYSVTLSNKTIWKGNTKGLIDACEQILTEYTDQNIVMTLRQLYYQLVSRDLIPNDMNMYKKLSSILTKARYNGLLDWGAMEDLTRTSTRHSQWENVSDIMTSALLSYRKPRWRNQPYHVELLTEKEALSSVLAPIANDWHIYFTVNRGFNSASLTYRLAERVKERIEQGQDVVFLYLGDHDPSGLDMVRDIRDRISEFLKSGHVSTSRFAVRHIALTIAQVREFTPPPNPAKESDTRFKAYQKEFGDESWEVDALRPDVMKQLIDSAVNEYVDMSQLQRVKQEEIAEKFQLQEILDTINESA